MIFEVSHIASGAEHPEGAGCYLGEYYSVTRDSTNLPLSTLLVHSKVVELLALDRALYHMI